MMICKFFMIFLAIASIFVDQVSTLKDPNVRKQQRKPFRLAMLGLMQFSGFEPSDGRTSVAATRFVIDAVNARSDILPDYEIQPVFQDEGLNSYNAPKHLANFEREFESGSQNKHGFYRSPVTLGPASSISCPSYAMLLTPIKMVGITSACQAPIFSGNRKMFPNIFRVQPPGELVAYSRIAFISRITKWANVALLTSSRQLDFQTALIFQRASMRRGINVAWFDTIDTTVTDGTMVSLKASKLRVIVADFGRNPMLVDFLCATYRFGLTGSRYLFLALSNAYSDPYLLPDVIDEKTGCTRKIVIEQLKYCLFVGMMPIWNENNVKSWLGYNLIEFEVLFDKYTNGTLRNIPDYGRRHAAHDVALMAVQTLDKAEKLLNKKNMTLANFHSDRTEVASAINESITSLEFLGLRYGRERFSQRLEMDSEPNAIFSWSPATNSLRSHYKIIAGSDISNPDTYDLTLLEPIGWLTGNQKPPADKAKQIEVVKDVSDNLVYIVSGISPTLSLIQIGTAIYLTIINKYRNSRQSVWSKWTFIAGCLILNIDAICFAVGMEGTAPESTLNTVLCHLRAIFTTIALTVIHAFIFTRLICYSRGLVGKVSFQTSGSREGTLIFTVRNNDPKTKVIQALTKIYPRKLSEKHERFSLYVALGFTFFNMIILIVWFLYDPISYQLIKSGNYFNDYTDSYVTYSQGSCVSKYQTIWMTTLGITQGVMLLGGSFLAYTLRVLASQESISLLVPGLKDMRTAQINCLTLFLATVMILMGFEGGPSDQQSVMAVSLVIFSAATYLVIFLPMLIRSKRHLSERARGQSISP